ncbi:MAG: tRNA (guanosine(46)-N7)-methyltransferase TrmB [Alphaproteobacteria bacterium]|nr:tRNA (guanosine(46)-N7)-methyltransferase TrmB [Alphaproteobacteria bacterium]
MPDRTSFPSEPRSFGRRKGKKLRPGRLALLDDLLPRIAVPRPAPGESVDPRALFAPAASERVWLPERIWLEVGFGGGEHLAAQAAAHPDVGIIGCEVFVNGVASLLRHVDEAGLGNVRIFPDDARFLLNALPDRCLERVFVLFPDPWPKRRHAERRFISPANLDLLARLLKAGGELRIATDDVTYMRWVLAHAPIHPGFRWLAGRPGDWRTPPADWVATRYETKAIREGRPPLYLRFERRDYSDGVGGEPTPLPIT